jgi:hypothetical protein
VPSGGASGRAGRHRGRSGSEATAKTDRTDACASLLAARRLPKSWIAPEQVLEMRARDLLAPHC